MDHEGLGLLRQPYPPPDRLQERDADLRLQEAFAGPIAGVDRTLIL